MDLIIYSSPKEVISSKIATLDCEGRDIRGIEDHLFIL